MDNRLCGVLGVSKQKAFKENADVFSVTKRWNQPDEQGECEHDAAPQQGAA